MSKRKVLFLCTGNSCRSQMAEAIVNARLSEEWEAVSAGTIPAGYVHPKALAALQEIGKMCIRDSIKAGAYPTLAEIQPNLMEAEPV